jgi:hypothetical protein
MILTPLASNLDGVSSLSMMVVKPANQTTKSYSEMRSKTLVIPLVFGILVFSSLD